MIAVLKAEKDTVSVGDVYRYYIHLKNDSKYCAHNIMVWDFLADNLSFIENSVEIDGRPQFGCDLKTGVRIKKIHSGDSVAISFLVYVDAYPLGQGGQILNQAIIAYSAECITGVDVKTIATNESAIQVLLPVPQVSDIHVRTAACTYVIGTIMVCNRCLPVSFYLLKFPAHGTVHLSDLGVWEYRPFQGFCGRDNFQVEVSNVFGGRAVSTVYVEVLDVKVPPRIFDQVYDTIESVPVKGIVKWEACGDINLLLACKPLNGTLIVEPDGHFVYEPYDGFVGVDCFYVTAKNFCGIYGRITINVLLNLKPPVLPDKTITTEQNTKVGGMLDAENPGICGCNIQYFLNQKPLHGKVMLSPSGKWSYYPYTDYTGGDLFQVLAVNKCGLSTQANILIKINPRENKQGFKLTEYIIRIPEIGQQGFHQQYDYDFLVDEEKRVVIHGTVRTPEGEPVSGAIAKFYKQKLSSELSCRQEMVPIGHVITDECGHFVFGPLAENMTITIKVFYGAFDSAHVVVKNSDEKLTAG